MVRKFKIIVYLLRLSQISNEILLTNPMWISRGDEGFFNLRVDLHAQ